MAASQAPPGMRGVEEHLWPARHVNFDLVASGQAVLTFAAVLYGWSIRNPSNTALANVDIYDGGDASGVPAFPVTLDWNESSREIFGERGILMEVGVFVNVTLGEVKGSLFYRRLKGR